MNILAIGAHPDDVEFGLGGTIAKHVKLGHNVYILILSDGERDINGYFKKSERREEESIKAQKILGITESNVKFSRLKELLESQLVLRTIEAEIKDKNPDRIYTHTVNDRHQDHRAIGWISLSSGRYVPEILMYEVYSVLPSFSPNFIVELDDTLLNAKVEALKCHLSQFKDLALLQKMIESNSIKRAMDSIGGREGFIRYAEAFECRKIVKKGMSI